MPRCHRATYPAINVPNGFDDRGSPTNFTIFAQPYREEVVLAVAQIYQDRAGFHTVSLIWLWLIRL